MAESFVAATMKCLPGRGSIDVEWNMAIRLIVADDREVIRLGIKRLFRESPIQVIGESSNLSGLVWQTEKLRPDVVLMDVSLGGDDSLGSIATILGKDANSRVIVFSKFDNPTYVARSYAWGASDYLLKQFSCPELITAITQVAQGDAPTQLGLMRTIVRSLREKSVNGKQSELLLTARESQVLRHLSYGLSNREIGLSLEVSVETVKEHVQNTLRKLGLTDRTQAAVWAVRHEFV